MKKRIIRIVTVLGLALMISVNACTPANDCSDGVQNGTETGVDCGGNDCPACTVAPTCTDGVQNGTETGIDCGGSCPACVVATTCTDGIQNGNETGVDCGGSDCPACQTNSEPSPTKTYYIKYKVDGIWKLYQTSNPGWQDCGSCACFLSDPFASSNRASIEVCENAIITSGLIQSWENSPMGFDYTVSQESAVFYFNEGGTTTTANTSSGAPGTLNISSIVNDGSVAGYQMFKATGTFECEMEDSSQITEGSFVIRLSEGT